MTERYLQRKRDGVCARCGTGGRKNSGRKDILHQMRTGSEGGKGQKTRIHDIAETMCTLRGERLENRKRVHRV